MWSAMRGLVKYNADAVRLLHDPAAWAAAGITDPELVRLWWKAGFDHADAKEWLPAVQHCACRKCHPGRSRGMFVLVEGAAEAIKSADVESGKLVRIGDRFGQRLEWPGVGDALVRPVCVVEGLELA
jgi:hypothetical protein